MFNCDLKDINKSSSSQIFEIIVVNLTTLKYYLYLYLQPNIHGGIDIQDGRNLSNIGYTLIGRL